MKIWLKCIIAMAIGLLAGFVLPLEKDSWIIGLSAIMLNFGRYVLLPLLFFSAAIAAFELYESKMLHKIISKAILAGILSMVSLGFIGLLAAFLFAPGRIPLAADTASPAEAIPGPLSILGQFFPSDAFSTLGNFDFLLPAVIFAIILGLAFSHDKTATKPVVVFFDSMSRILWQANSFLVEILPLALVFASTAVSISIFKTQRIAMYSSLFLTIAIETLFVVLVFMPLALWLFNRKDNPFKTMYAFLAPSLIALVSGHSYVQAGASAKHLKESLGVRRRASSLSLPLALFFGKAGTTMVTATAFVSVLNSYSNLGLGSNVFFWILLMAPLYSLFLGAKPGLGPLCAVAALCGAYGRGFESGYILFIPVALPLSMLAAYLDALMASCIVYAVANSEGLAQQKDTRHFI
ncbi:cation:dicarboxylase symporter family transporter [Spirochaetota bacterium]